MITKPLKTRLINLNDKDNEVVKLFIKIIKNKNVSITK